MLKKNINLIKKNAIYGVIPIVFFAVLGYQKYSYYSESERLDNLKQEIVQLVEKGKMDEAKILLAELHWQYVPFTGGQEETINSYTNTWNLVNNQLSEFIKNKLSLNHNNQKMNGANY